MIRVLLALLLVVRSASPDIIVVRRAPVAAGGGAPQFISQFTDAVTGTGAGLLFVTPARSVSSGDDIFYFIGWQATCPGDITAMTVTGTGGDTFTLVGSITSQTFICTAKYRLFNATGNASYQITATTTTAPSGAASVVTIRMSGATSVDAHCTGHVASGSTSPCSASITTSATAFVACGIYDYYTDTIGAGSGFTLGSQADTGGRGKNQYGEFTASTFTPEFAITGTNYTQIHCAAFI